MILQHDHGFANNIGTTANPNSIDAQWYGINSHLYYDLKDNLSIGMRAEWFRDQNGARVCSPGRVAAATNGSGNSYAIGGQPNNSTCTAASYYEVTAGLNWKPTKWLNLRPNVRYDWVDRSNGATNPFADGKTAQFIFSNDFTVTF